MSVVVALCCQGKAPDSTRKNGPEVRAPIKDAMSIGRVRKARGVMIFLASSEQVINAKLL